MLNSLKIFISLLNVVVGLRTFTIIAPEFIHSARKYSISLAVNNLNVSSLLEVTIESINFKDSIVAQLPPNGVQIVEFNLPKLPKDEYILHVEGESGIYAKSSMSLKYAVYKPIFVVQTDKYLYRRDETLYYRVLCMDEKLRPIDPENIVDIRVITADYHVVLNIENVKFKNYVSKGELYFIGQGFNVPGPIRLAIFMDGELQTDILFEIIDEDYNLKKGEEKSKESTCFQHNKHLISTTVFTSSKNNETVSTYFSVELKREQQGKSLKLSELAVFNISSNKPFKNFIYTVIGRGNILSSGRHELEDDTKHYSFMLKPNNEMAPLSKLIIYCIDDNNEFHYDESMFNVERKLENELVLTTSSTSEPNEKIEFHIHTSPNSYVGLVAIEKEEEEELDCYEMNSNNNLNIYELLTHYGGSNKLQRGEITGSLISTTVNKFKYKQQKYRKIWSEDRNLEAQKKFNKWKKTWFFAEIANTTTGNLTLAHNLPNDKTKWQITAFSLNKETGLGYTVLEPPLQTKKSYNVSFDLPLNIYAQEIFVIEIRIENFLKENLNMKVEYVPGVFDIELERIFNENFNNVNITPEGFIKLKYCFRTRTAGLKKLKFLFFSKGGNDRQIAKLRVKYKGLRQIDELYLTADLTRNLTFERLIWPTKSFQDILGMHRSQIDIYSNPVQPILECLKGDIFAEYYRTAEQLVSIMAMAKLSLDFIKSNDETISDLEIDVTRKMHLAFMILLDLRGYKSGGFRMFPLSKPNNESIWLTAYILRWLPSFKMHFPIDETVLEQSLEFLAQAQNEDGSFNEKGLVFNSNNGNDTLALTAHVIWAFLEQNNISDIYNPMVVKSINFIEENLPKSDNLYSKVLSVYVLQKTAFRDIKKELQILQNLAIINKEYKFWGEASDSNLNNVATTALILLTTMNTNDDVDMLPTVKWLNEKGNIYNFKQYTPTQATVLSLEGVIQFSKKINITTDLDFTIGHQRLIQMDYTELFLKDGETNENHLEFKAQDANLKLQADGQGFALVHVHYDYAIEYNEESADNFEIIIERPQHGPLISFEIKVCIKYKGNNPTAELTILEVGLLSGYMVKSEQIELLAETEDFVKHVSINPMESNLRFFLLGLERDLRKCLVLELHQIHLVAKHAKVPVLCYEYTNPSYKAMNFYVINTKICDVCYGDSECMKKCSEKKG